MKIGPCRLLGHAICDMIRRIGELLIAGQIIVEQPAGLSGLTE